MNFIKKFSSISSKYQIVPKYHIRTIYLSSKNLADSEAKTEKVSTETFDVLDELRKPALTEEEIMKKRFKARLPERLYRLFVLKEAVPIESKYDFEMYRLRSYYARHGSDSKLNPGICWPTREEILETMEYDKIFEPPLQVRIKNVEEARLAEENRKKEVEAEVDKNMANLDKNLSDYHAKIANRNIEIAELKLKKERLVEEISEYLGYDIDPHDPRFQEAVAQREKEKKKALKVKKQQESYEKMLVKLKKMAES